MEKRLVHLVDDDAAVRGMLARLLDSGGYEVRQYESGSALVAAVHLLDRGLILLDINMPGPDGFAVQQMLTNQAVDLPVIMMTGGGDHSVLAWKAGVAQLMLKPFGRSELLAVLEEVTAAFPAAAAKRLQPS